MSKLKVVMVTPDRQVVKTEVFCVTAPTVLGEITILPEHRALLADLKAGPVLLGSGTTAETYVVSDGFIEVDNNTVTILAETAERAQDIDVERAQKALSSSKAAQNKLLATEPEYLLQQARQKRAEERLAAAQKVRHP